MEETTWKETAKRQPEERRIVKNRRVGTITLGGTLIFFGVLFLVHIFAPGLSYAWIFRLWPISFISLGMEVLMVGIRKGEEERQIYDGMAMFLTALLLLFSMGMAVMDMAIQYGGYLHL